MTRRKEHALKAFAMLASAIECVSRGWFDDAALYLQNGFATHYERALQDGRPSDFYH